MGTTYRVITRKLRVQRGPGNPDLVVARPMKQTKDGGNVFTDSDAAPTLITFDEHCQIDIPFLLAIGVIAVYEPAVSEGTPTGQPAAKGKERPRG